MSRRRLDVLKGFSGRFIADLDRLERTRCCPHPVEQRQLLGFVARALPRKSARELRKRLDELDALY
jgi:hypothetical protein